MPRPRVWCRAKGGGSKYQTSVAERGKKNKKARWHKSTDDVTSESKTSRWAFRVWLTYFSILLPNAERQKDRSVRWWCTWALVRTTRVEYKPRTMQVRQHLMLKERCIREQMSYHYSIKLDLKLTGNCGISIKYGTLDRNVKRNDLNC